MWTCNKCKAKITEELMDCVMDYECQGCGGRLFTKTVKHPQRVDDERFISPKKMLDATIGPRKVGPSRIENSS